MTNRPKAERKRLQVETAPTKSKRAQVIKLADKISNIRSIIDSPPADWSHERKKEYFAWAKKVVDEVTAPNAMLKAEFERTLQKFDQMSVTSAAGVAEKVVNRLRRSWRGCQSSVRNYRIRPLIAGRANITLMRRYPGVLW